MDKATIDPTEIRSLFVLLTEVVDAHDGQLDLMIAILQQIERGTVPAVHTVRKHLELANEAREHLRQLEPRLADLRVKLGVGIEHTEEDEVMAPPPRDAS